MRKLFKSTWALLAMGLILIGVDLGVRAVGAANDVSNAGVEARGFINLFNLARERRVQAHQENERVKKDLRYMSEELDRETLGGESQRSLKEYSEAELDRIAALRTRGEIVPKLSPVLDQLEKIYRELAKLDYAKDWAGDLVKAINEELRWAADNGATPDEMVALLKEELKLPETVPGDGDADDLAFFPENLPVDKFLKLGPIKIFLAKHRQKRPKTYVQTTPEDIVAGKHNVQIGVEVEAKVDSGSLFFWDQDYCFNIGSLHLEITPEWRLKHPGFHLPKAGERVRLKGWTYYDYFHKTELEYDPEDPVVGAKRAIVWEVHPVQDIEVLPAN